MSGLFDRSEFDTYTAIDVETPNRYSRSICSIGLVHVDESGEPVRLHYLVNPDDDFDAINISIHGIRPEDVENEPTLDAIWRTGSRRRWRARAGVVATLGVALAIAIMIYRKYHTLEEDEILKVLK